MNEDTLINHDVQLSIKIGGKATEHAAHIISAETHTAYHKLSSAEVVLNDGGLSDTDFAIGDSEAFLIGKELAVMVGDKKADKCVFKGIIEMQNITLKSGTSFLKITAKHPAYKMTIERKLRSFEDMTDYDIIEQICNEYGIDLTMKATNVKHERLVQYNCTDWDFINLRAQAMGMLLWTHPEGITISAPEICAKPVLDIINGLNLQDLDFELDARRAYKKYQTDAWNYTNQEIDEAENAGGQSDTPLGDLSATDLADKNNNESIICHKMTTEENTDGLNAWNEMATMRMDLSRVVGKVEVWGVAPIEPGNIVDVKNVGKRFNGKTIVSSVSHKIDGSQWLTALQLGIDEILYADTYDNIATKPADGELPPVNGLQIAKVKALEGDPLGEDRIYICLLGNEDTKLWARLATLDAGNERGTVFCAEVDDEVIVGFINDHPNQAVVLGMLHSSSAPSPIEKKDDNHKKAIVTREKLQVIFDDEKKAITVSTPGGNKLVLNDDDGGIFIEDQSGNKITMDSNGITVETPTTIKLKATQDVTIEGYNTNVKANAQLKMQGTAGCELSASGNTVVKGAIVQIN